MKYLLYIVLIVITLFCVITILFQKQELTNLKANLNQTNSQLHKFINKDTTLNKELLTQEFKEDYYITQLGIVNKQMITFVSILFSIALALSVGFFVWYMSEFKTKIENKIDENTTTQNNQIQIQIVHSNELGLSFANTVLTTAETFKEINKSNYVFQTLMGLANYKHYGYSLNHIEATNKIILSTLKILNLEVTQIFTNNQPSRHLLWTYFSELTSIRDNEIIDEVNKLRAKIKDIEPTI